MTQFRLGRALGDLGRRVEGPRAVELLNQAVLAFRSALQVFTRDARPRTGPGPRSTWAAPSVTLGVAWRVRWPPTLLNQAVEAYACRPRGPHPRRPTPGLGRDPVRPGPRPR